MARWLVIFGIVLIVAGLVWPWVSKLGLAPAPGTSWSSEGEFPPVLPDHDLDPDQRGAVAHSLVLKRATRSVRPGFWHDRSIAHHRRQLLRGAPVVSCLTAGSIRPTGSVRAKRCSTFWSKASAGARRTLPRSVPAVRGRWAGPLARCGRGGADPVRPCRTQGGGQPTLPGPEPSACACGRGTPAMVGPGAAPVRSDLSRSAVSLWPGRRDAWALVMACAASSRPMPASSSSSAPRTISICPPATRSSARDAIGASSCSCAIRAVPASSQALRGAEAMTWACA